tara:strand:+ start:6404 stop:7717 length:1314 start_codon:yes stop_codon:yes gene_type:complete
MSVHARLGPSNQRWPNCPGSIREEAAYPDVSGEAAIDGTGSHLLLELCLRHGVRAADYDGQIIGANDEDNPNGWLVAPDRCERVQMGLDYVEQRVALLKEQHPSATITVEAESHADPGGMFGRDDWHGTSDITITAVVGEVCAYIEVIDYKDGRGWVNAKDNTQLLAYLGGKVRPFIASGPDLVRPFLAHRVGQCRVTIIQPKTTPTVRCDDVDVNDLIKKLIELSHAARLTDDPDAPLIADGKGGKGYCKWCRHKSNCNAGTQLSIEKVKNMDTDMKVLDVLGEVATADLTKLESSQLVGLSDVKDDLLALFTKIDTELERRLETGEKVPGRAMLPGNGSNVWNDSEEAIAKMLKARKFKKDDIYPSKLISPAQVLKSELLNAKQKAAIEKEYISHKVSNKLKLTKVTVVEKDDAALMFGDIDAVSIFDAPPVSFL